MVLLFKVKFEKNKKIRNKLFKKWTYDTTKIAKKIFHDVTKLNSKPDKTNKKYILENN